jgi:hypothetical protein
LHIIGPVVPVVSPGSLLAVIGQSVVDVADGGSVVASLSLTFMVVAACVVASGPVVEVVGEVEVVGLSVVDPLFSVVTADEVPAVVASVVLA